MLDHRLVGQAGKIIIGLVVLANVVEAEAVILALAVATLWRGIKSGLAAALPLASRAGFAQQTVLIRLDAQAVEEFRVELHGFSIMGSVEAPNKNGGKARIRVS